MEAMRNAHSHGREPTLQNRRSVIACGIGIAAAAATVVFATISLAQPQHSGPPASGAEGTSGSSVERGHEGRGSASASASGNGGAAAAADAIRDAPVAQPSQQHEHPVTSAPVRLDPAHPIAMNDPAPAVGGAVATGTNATLATTGSDLSATGPAGVPLADTFTLASKPDSSHVLFLDPRGAVISGRAWTAYPGSPYRGKPLTLAAYTFGDTDPAFDADDLTQLQIAWQEVAADYAAFDINVTLAPQDAAAIGRDSTGDTAFGTQVMLTSTPDPAKKAGGIAWLGASTGYDATHDPMYWQPALDFSSSGSTGHNIGQTAAHEAGHTWGLVHESDSRTYYPGSTTWGPIMGTSYYSAMGQWSMGEFKGARLNMSRTVTNPTTKRTTVVYSHQDEVGTIRSVLGGAEADNGPDASPTDIAAGQTLNGLITSNADTDSFTYTGTGGVLLHVAPTASISDLDLALDVIDTTATDDPVLASGLNPPLRVLASGGYGSVTGGEDSSFFIPTTDSDHTYRITVAGGGNGASPYADATAYSSYGSLGSYALSLTAESDGSAGGSTGGGSSDPGAGTSSGKGFTFDAVSVLTRTPGVAMKFKVDYDQGGLDPADVLWAWKSSRPSCVFSAATSADPRLTCLATDTGSVTVTGTATPAGSPAQSRSVTFALAGTKQAAPQLGLSVAGQTTDAVSVCSGNTGVIRGTILDQYGRPVYGDNVRLFTGSAVAILKSDIHGWVSASMSTRPAASYSIDGLATGVFPAQATRVVRTVSTTPPPCFGSGTTVTLGQADVTAIPGVATPLTATVAAGSLPVTGVPVSFTETYADANGKQVSKLLGAATTNEKGVATYSLKVLTTTPDGTLTATVAKSAIVPVSLVSAAGTLSVATSPTMDFDPSSFAINGDTEFTATGHHEDHLISGVAATVAGRLTAGWGATAITPAGIPVTVAVTYPNPKGGADLRRTYAGTTAANGWFQISVLNPPAGDVTVLAPRSTYLPAVAEVPFDDADGGQASFTVSKWNGVMTPAAATIAPGQMVYLTATLVSPILDGSPRKAPATNLTFTARWVSADGKRYATWPRLTSRSSVAALGTPGLGAGTITITPVASTGYTAVASTVTIQ